MKENIISKANNLGIGLIGFTKLEYDKTLEEILIKQELFEYKTPFQVGNIEDKAFKNEKFKRFNSAIVVGVPYPNGFDIINNIKENECYLSTCSWGEDYHEVLRSKLNKILELLNGYDNEIYVDNNILDERRLAYNAGLGYYGKNNLLINDKYGTYFFIGVILTSCIFVYDNPIIKNCLMCNNCLKECPTNAINENGILNGKKCLSYITQKKVLDEDEKNKLNNCVYGCDICSRVCPHNKDLNKFDNEFSFEGNEIFDKNKFLELSIEEFNNKYGHKSCGWRNKDIFDRNVEISKLNDLK